MIVSDDVRGKKHHASSPYQLAMAAWSVYRLNFDAIMPTKDTNAPQILTGKRKRKPRRVLQMHMGSSRTYGFADEDDPIVQKEPKKKTKKNTGFYATRKCQEKAKTGS